MTTRIPTNLRAELIKAGVLRPRAEHTLRPLRDHGCRHLSDELERFVTWRARRAGRISR